MFFDDPKNFQNLKVHIHEKYILIATCNYDHLNSLSPALLNPFNSVYLGDHLE
jgi:hypothetical protein